MTTTAARTTAQAAVRLGDVVLDSYANPAVIVSTGVNLGTAHARWTIMQTCGSDRGRVTDCPTKDGLPYPANLTAEQVEKVRAIVRTEAKRQGWRWDATGITRAPARREHEHFVRVGRRRIWSTKAECAVCGCGHML